MYHNEPIDMSEALRLVYEKQKKKLDPVGQEDGDVDNDGDEDSSDSYLKNRRKAIGKAIKNEEVEDVEEGLKQARKNVGADTCWDGYKAEGTKKKDGKEVPNCVKEAFFFTEEEIDSFQEIDEATDEQLITFMEELILELAEDDEDLLEICEALEEVDLLNEASDKYYDSAVKSSKEAASKTRVERMKGAAKEAGKRVKAGAAAGMKMVKPVAKSAVKGAAKGAGYAVGAAQRGGSSLKKSFAAGYKRGKEGAPGKKEAPKGESKPAAKEKNSSDDGTGGKLDALLASTRGTKSGSSGGGSSSASSGGGESKEPKAKKPGLLKRLGSAVKSGLKKAVGKTARAVSGRSEKLAKRMGEEYEQIAHLYESGLFEVYEIENIIEAELAAKARAKAVEMGRKRRSSKEYKQGGARGTGKNERAAYNLSNIQNTPNADLGRQKEVDKSSGIEGHMKKALAKKGKYNYRDVLDKRDPKKNPKHTDNQEKK